MSLENARQFVADMREENTYRQAALKDAADQKLAAFLQEHGLTFDLRHLVIAMAGCMDEMAQGCEENA